MAEWEGLAGGGRDCENLLLIAEHAEVIKCSLRKRSGDDCTLSGTHLTFDRLRIRIL